MAISLELSRVGIEVNLPTGGTYDLLVVSTPEYPKGSLSFKLETTPRKITGIQKVAQTFLRHLFTQKGTDLIRPLQGTIFPELAVGANRTNTTAEFTSQISSAIRDAELQTQYTLNDSSSDKASQLDKIVIRGFDTGRESLYLFLQLITKAGETASVAVPFPELDLPLTSD